MHDAELTASEERIIVQLFTLPRRLDALGFLPVAAAIQYLNRSITRGDLEALLAVLAKFDRASSDPRRN